MTDAARNATLAKSLRQYATVGSSLDLPTPKRTAFEAADELERLAAVEALLRQVDHAGSNWLDYKRLGHASASWEAELVRALRAVFAHFDSAALAADSPAAEETER